MVRRSIFLLAGLALLAVAGCGGDGKKKFDLAGIGVTFEYPAKFKPLKTFHFQRSTGNKAIAKGGVSLDDANAIIISRYDLKATITKENVGRYKKEVDNVISSLAGRPVSGREVEYGGLPGYEYVVELTAPANGQSRMAVLFDQASEYLINCQSTPDKREAIESGCRTALDSVESK